jgi:hypothetical protein
MLLPPKLVQIFSPASNQRASLTMGDHVHAHQRTTEIVFAKKVLTKRDIIFHDSAIRRFLLVQQSLAKRQDQLRFLKNNADENTKV